MNQSKKYTIIFAALGMLALILDGQTAVSGARDGIELCLRTVIPSLFPFFILSIILTGSLSDMNAAFLRPVSALFNAPAGTETILLTSFLGGYPVGAQCISQAYQDGQISRTQAERMLFYCNNAGPSFIFGMIAMQFTEPWYGWLIWLIQIFSAAAVSRCLPECEQQAHIASKHTIISLPTALSRAIKNISVVCGWVLLFRIMTAFLDRWFLWLFPRNLQIFLTGILELTNGCCLLNELKNDSCRFILSSVMLSIGGICVFMQTSSVLEGLSIKTFLFGKVMQSCFAFLLSLSVCILMKHPISSYKALIAGCMIFLILTLPYFLRKMQKRYSLSPKIVV